jgi:transposase
MGKKVNNLYVGIDVHSRQHKVAIMSTQDFSQPEVDWKQARFLTIRNRAEDFNLLYSEIQRLVSNPLDVAIAIDHTGGHYSMPLVWFLQDKGYRTYHLEAKAVKAIRERLLDEESKTDTIDAASTAYLLYLRDCYGLSFRISAISPELKSKAFSIKCLILQRQMYIKMATQCTNRLRQLLVTVFPEGEAQYFHQMLNILEQYPTPSDMLACQDISVSKKCKSWEKIRALAHITIGAPIDMYRELIIDLSRRRREAVEQCRAIELQLQKEVIAHPYGNILFSFPRIGTISAATIISEVKDIKRWPNKKKLKKALGVYSISKQSGNSLGVGRLGNEGSRHGRRVLFQVVFGYLINNASENDFRDYYLRQTQISGKPKLKAIVSTMGKLVEIIYHCLTRGELYEYQGIYRVPK